MRVTSPSSRSTKLGQYFGRMFRETDVDMCCSHMVPFDQPEAALVSYLRGGPPKNLCTDLYGLAGHAYAMDRGCSPGINTLQIVCSPVAFVML